MVNFFNSSILMDVMLCTAGSLVVLVLTFATFIFSVFDKKKEMGIFKTVFLKQVFKIDLWIQAFVLLFLPLFLWGASDVFLILFLWENSDVFFQFFLFLLYLRGVWIFVDIIKDSVCWALDSCKVNTGKFKESKFKDFFISNYKCENYENF